MTPPQHLWFFSQASMLAMAISLGLEVEHLDHPWKVVPLSLISFQLARMAGLRPKRLAISSRLGLSVQLIRCHARRAAEAKPMSDRLSLSQVAALMAYAATTAGGQLLFKTPALRGAGDGPLAERIAGFLLNGYFFVALILYAALTVLWVWILSFTPLSRAYPFLALAFALTPALGCSFLPNRCRCGRDHRADLVWAFLHCGMSDGVGGAASMGCHRCLQ